MASGTVVVGAQGRLPCEIFGWALFRYPGRSTTLYGAPNRKLWTDVLPLHFVV